MSPYPDHQTLENPKELESGFFFQINHDKWHIPYI